MTIKVMVIIKSSERDFGTEVQSAQAVARLSCACDLERHVNSLHVPPNFNRNDESNLHEGSDTFERVYSRMPLDAITTFCLRPL